jgi:hypothetical protein
VTGFVSSLKEIDQVDSLRIKLRTYQGSP